MWRIRKRNSIQKLKGVTYGTRGVFSYLRDLLKILQFGFLCNVTMLALNNVATSQRRDISSSTPWNVATLDLNVATSVLPFSGTSRNWIIPSLELRDVGSQRRDVCCTSLWNVTTLSPNVATLPLVIA